MKKDLNFDKKAKIGKQVKLWLKIYTNRRHKFYSGVLKQCEKKIETLVHKHHILIQFGSLLAAILTVIALGISVYQTILSFKSSDENKKILDAVSTHYVSEFPAFLLDINSHIDKAEGSIIIQQDVLSFGSFSNPKEFHRFLTMITRIANNKKNIKIKFRVYNDTLFSRETRFQFLGHNEIRRDLRKNHFCNEKWDNDSISRVYEKLQEADFNKNVKEKHKIDKFIEHDFNCKNEEFDSFPKLQSISENFKKVKTYNEFYKLLFEFKNQVAAIIREYNNIEIELVRDRFTMYSWLIDGREMIFCFPGDNEHDELAFYTHDRNFIDMARNSGINAGDLDNERDQ